MSTRPTVWNRVLARMSGEVSADALEAYQRASLIVYESLDRVESRRREARSNGQSAWAIPHAAQVEMLCVWNAWALQTLGDAILQADYALDPLTVGFVPPITAEQILRLYSPIEGWLSRAGQARLNPAHRIDVAIPSPLPPWSQADPLPEPHIAGMASAMRSLRDHAEADLIFVNAAPPATRDQQRQLNALRAEMAAAALKARYADDMMGARASREVHKSVEEHIKDAIAGFFRAGQLLAMPALASPAPGDQNGDRDRNRNRASAPPAPTATHTSAPRPDPFGPTVPTQRPSPFPPPSPSPFPAPSPSPSPSLSPPHSQQPAPRPAPISAPSPNQNPASQNPALPAARPNPFPLPGAPQAPARPAAPAAPIAPAPPAAPRFDIWCLSDPEARAKLERDPQARAAIEKMWRLDPDPDRTLSIQARIDKSRAEGQIVFAMDSWGTRLEHFFRCPWQPAYTVRRPVSIGGHKLVRGQQFIFNVSGEGVDRGAPFERDILIGSFAHTDELDLGSPR